LTGGGPIYKGMGLENQSARVSVGKEERDKRKMPMGFSYSRVG